jgi:hypothetical protein
VILCGYTHASVNIKLVLFQLLVSMHWHAATSHGLAARLYRTSRVYLRIPHGLQRSFISAHVGGTRHKGVFYKIRPNKKLYPLSPLAQPSETGARKFPILCSECNLHMKSQASLVKYQFHHSTSLARAYITLYNL